MPVTILPGDEHGSAERTVVGWGHPAEFGKLGEAHPGGGKKESLLTVLPGAGRRKAAAHAGMLPQQRILRGRAALPVPGGARAQPGAHPPEPATKESGETGSRRNLNSPPASSLPLSSLSPPSSQSR